MKKIPEKIESCWMCPYLIRNGDQGKCPFTGGFVWEWLSVNFILSGCPLEDADE